MKRLLGIVIAGALVTAAPVMADVISSKNRTNLFKSQKKLLDTRAASQYNNSVRLKPQSIYTPSKWATPPYKGRYNGPFLNMAREAARKHGIPEDLFLRLVQQESNWNPRAKSHKGALGLAQLMPATARYLRVDPLDPAQNLDGGARYLKEQFAKFRTWQLALAAYNAGPAAVEKHGGIPPYRETRNYVRVITGQR